MMRVSVIAIAIAMSMSCGHVANLTGGASTTGNAHVSGVIVFENGNAVLGAVVKLVPAQYDPIRDSTGIRIDTTDCAGRYTFVNTDSGDYNVMVLSSDQKSCAFTSNVGVNQDTVEVPPMRLEQPGQIKVMLQSGIDYNNGYVYIPGTTIAVPLSSGQDFVVIGSVPACVVASVNYASPNSNVSAVIRYSISVVSLATTIVYNPAWHFARKLLLNTTATGAGVAGTVTGFPVLIRLSASNFDFSQAQSTGADIRFTKSGNTFLHYEIERFDAVNQLAEIWVKVDTVLGNNATQSITMYWGNSGAADSSNGSAVFASADGWSGVWHLPEDAPDTVTAALYKNSVENANYGDDKVLSNGKTGIIGEGQNFTWSYDTSYIHADRIQVLNATLSLKPQQLTLSGWMQVFVSDSSGSEMASMGDDYLIRVDRFGRVRFVVYSTSSPYNIACWDSSVNFVDSSWHYYAGSYDGKEVRLYVDGILRSVESFTVPVEYTRGQDFVMGGHGTHKKGYNLFGNLDEINCSSIARSPDWIHLMFENQKTDGKLISTIP